MAFPQPEARVAELCRRLGTLYTGAVADILDELGHRNQCLPSTIRPLTDATKVAGPVFTIRGQAMPPGQRPDPRYRQMDMLDAIFPGAVVVIDPGDEHTAAHWGELMSNTARNRGATGCVIHGGLRDTPQILDIGFPVFRVFHSPLSAAVRWEIAEFDAPIRIGGVDIHPGDYVLGDVDGVLVLPAAIVERVVAMTEEVKRKETIVRGELQKGGSIRTLFEEYKVF
ncbi:MAG: RraA family protein [Alphaproteobacteria bacterium]|nr:RraA family protein [Alphaproteobacteria bacterium]